METAIGELLKFLTNLLPFPGEVIPLLIASVPSVKYITNLIIKLKINAWFTKGGKYTQYVAGILSTLMTFIILANTNNLTPNGVVAGVLLSFLIWAASVGTVELGRTTEEIAVRKTASKAYRESKEK